MGRVGNTASEEETFLNCQDEEDCWLKSQNRVGRSSEAELNKRETKSCDQLPAKEKTICDLFVGKRELLSSEQTSARRDRLVNPLLRSFYVPVCQPPFCKYRPGGKKKFMAKKDVRETGREQKANAVSSDTNDRKCSQADLLCSGNTGLGRKRSVS